MDQELIALKDVVIGYRRALMQPLSWKLSKGEFWGLVGPNGAGKSTLAKTILGLLPSLGGDLKLAEQLRFGYVPQRHSLNPDYPLSAFEVALMGRTDRLGYGRRPQENDRARVREELSRLDMGTLAERSYRSLSGGQQQRVLMARALVAEPDVLILDEPTEGMDMVGGADILEFLRSLNQERAITILMISHRLDDVIGAVTHLCLINKDTGLFEAGPRAEMIGGDRLTKLYRRAMGVHECQGRLHVHVDKAGGPEERP